MNLLPSFGQDGESAAPGRRPDAVRVRVIRAPAPKAKRSINLLKYKENLAPEAGIEPATIRLTVECSTAELLGNKALRLSRWGYNKASPICKHQGHKDDPAVELRNRPAMT